LVAYPDEEKLFEDLASIYREEIADLVSRGARYIQIDEVPLAMLCDPAIRQLVRDRGEDPEYLEKSYFTMLDRILDGRPAELTVGLHLCRGNYKAKWLSGGGYEFIAERLLGELDVDAFFLEYDTPRAGDFAPLRYLSSNKVAVLGLMSSKLSEMETAENLKRRVDDATRFVPLDRLAISPQCGFATSVGSRPMEAPDQFRKLELLVKTARQIWD
jgi:5-methyltetrahydropteroyltriglutamate--homocysteine methyltransferase